MTRNADQSALLRFINHEATAGAFLVAAAAAAMAVSNSALSGAYDAFLHLPVRVGVGALTLEKTLVHFVNDGLMAIFFFLVGLEIKREVLEGNLSSRDQVVLPAAAAAGGMAVPAAIYAAINWGTEEIAGWAIPAATDIAFALAVLSLVGARAPVSLKVFLLTLATLDDLGAVVIIALFYTDDLSPTGLAFAAGCIAALIALNRFRVDKTAPYILLGIAMWSFVLESGIHATLAGVVLAMTIPVRRRDGRHLLREVEEGLHPWVTFLILPLFAFANAGVPLAGVSLPTLLEQVPLGVAAGLALGKPLGVMLAVAVCVGLRAAKLPDGASWMQMLGVACLAGIGFTMSLFIGSLAFEADTGAAGVRLGVLTGSAVSAMLGVMILAIARGKDA